MSAMVGIDLGMTTACIGVVDPRRAAGPAVVPDADGARAVPAIVGFAEDGEPMFGQAARRLAATNPERAFAAVKAWLGRAAMDRELQAMLRGGSSAFANGGARGARSPGDIATMILAERAKDARSFLGAEIDGAVIAVPEAFGEPQRAALDRAAERAGFRARSFVGERVAAAIASASGANERLAVFDLGGHSFHFAVVEVSGGAGRLLFETARVTGGVDFDERMTQLLVEKCLAAHRVDLRTDKAALARARDAALAARHELSSWIEAEVNLPFVARSSAGEPVHFTSTLTRAEFDVATSDLIEQTIDACRRALKEAGVAAEKVDGVVLAGGMGRTPAVRRAVAELFAKDPRDGDAPEETVARGAALVAARGGEAPRRSSRAPQRGPQAPAMIGIVLGVGHAVPLLERGAPLPFRRTVRVTTTIDDQSFGMIHLVAGESPLAGEARTLLRVPIPMTAAGVRGTPRIELTLAVDEHGEADVTILDGTSGRERAIHLEAVFGANQPELEELVPEEAISPRKDTEAPTSKTDRGALQANAEALLFIVESAVPGCVDLVEGEVLDQATAAASEARAALRADDATLDAAYRRLDAVSLAIGKALAERAARGG